ncbi:hypothetical protein C8R44DRAFT_613319, partial [Mycena epipterygia]
PRSPTPVKIHPLLNGYAPSLHFDLAPSTLAPQRLVSSSLAHLQCTPLSATEMHEYAFHPAWRSLRILHARLPFFPIDLGPPADLPHSRASLISVGDILREMHRALHLRITAADWTTLEEKEREKVTMVFTLRCREEARRSGVPLAMVRDRADAERAKGVKRVDFLLGKTLFKGFVRAPEDPQGCVRMMTA